MGASSSVVRSKLETVNGSLRFLYESFLSTENSDKLNQLHEDLARYHEVRVALANFMWNRGMDNLIVLEMTLAINEAFICNLLMQDMWEDERDENSDTILYHMSLFSLSSAYEPFYKLSTTTLRTPPMSRSPSEEDLCVTN